MSAAPLVLVVDDSELVTNALRTLLDAVGFRSAAAHSVTEAIAAARARPPAAVLLDLTLPDGDGLEVLAGLAADGSPAPITVALTGHDNPETVARCLAAGCRAVLVKPVRAVDLMRVLADAGVAPVA